MPSPSTTRTHSASRYHHDPLGQRIEKRCYLSWAVPEQRNITYYVRDAQGNVMATYSREVDEWMPTDNYRLADWTLYGSSRLGLVKGTEFGTLGSVSGPEWQVTLSFVKNRVKQYELTNHLGNVLVIVSGEKDYLDTTGTWSYSIGRVLNAQDYYPFGMLMPGRQVHPEGYRFGFNGMEKDDEVKGLGNSLDFGARLYDSRLGKFLSLDPLLKNFPSESNYSNSGNSPILMMDAEGKHKILYIVFFADQGSSKIEPTDQKEIINKAQQILNLNGIDVKVVGLSSDHALNLGLLDKTDNVTYISNKEMFDKKGIPNPSREQAGWRSPSGVSIVNSKFFPENGRRNGSPDTDLQNQKIYKVTGEWTDNEAYMAITSIHEGIGHRFQSGHEGNKNLMTDGSEMMRDISPYPFETNSPYLKINSETKSAAQSYYGKPKEEWKGVPYKVEYQQSGVDNYTKQDRNVKKVE